MFDNVEQLGNDCRVPEVKCILYTVSQKMTLALHTITSTHIKLF